MLGHNKFWCVVWEADDEIAVFEQSDDFLEYFIANSPAMAGVVELTTPDAIGVRESFQDPECAFVGISLRASYRTQIGLASKPDDEGYF